MRARLIPTAELTARDVGHWRELAASAIESNPFAEPDYAMPLARALGAAGEVCVVAVEAPGGWRACLPVRASRGWHRYPARGMLGWRGHKLLTLLGTPLVSPSGSEAALTQLIDGMLSLRSVNFATLEWIGDDGPVSSLLHRVLADRNLNPIRFERFERAAVVRRRELSYVDTQLSSKRRRELRRQRRKIGEALGGEPEAVDLAAVDASYDEFIALEGSGWKRGAGDAMASHPAQAEFFREMCRAYAAQGRLQMPVLRVAGKTLAAQCNLLAGDVLFCLKVAYDERFAALSPGIQLEVDAIRMFHEDSGARMMDSCADAGNAMLNRLWPDRRAIATYAVPGGGAGGGISRAGLLVTRSLRDRSMRAHEAKRGAQAASGGEPSNSSSSARRPAEGATR